MYWLLYEHGRASYVLQQQIYALLNRLIPNFFRITQAGESFNYNAYQRFKKDQNSSHTFHEFEVAGRIELRFC